LSWTTPCSNTLRYSKTGNDDTQHSTCSARLSSNTLTPTTTPPAIKQAEPAKRRAHESLQQPQGASWVRMRRQKLVRSARDLQLIFQLPDPFAPCRQFRRLTRRRPGADTSVDLMPVPPDVERLALDAELSCNLAYRLAGSDRIEHRAPKLALAPPYHDDLLINTPGIRLFRSRKRQADQPTTSERIGIPSTGDRPSRTRY